MLIFVFAFFVYFFLLGDIIDSFGGICDGVQVEPYGGNGGQARTSKCNVGNGYLKEITFSLTEHDGYDRIDGLGGWCW